MNNTTFRNASQSVVDILSSTDPKKVLIIPVDFAKEKHVAKIGNASGEYLKRKPLTVFNNSAGVEFLSVEINKACTKHKILKKNVIIATEDPHSYAKPFFQKLHNSGFIVVQANAFNAKRLRHHSLASSDEIDCDGILNAVLNRQVQDLKGQDSTYESLKISVRSYHMMVKQSTRSKNQINKLVDRIFPGFLSKKKSGLEPFGRASVALLKKGISSVKMRNKTQKNLVSFLKKYHIKKVDAVAENLKSLQATELTFDSDLDEQLSKLLAIQTEMYCQICQSIHDIKSLCSELLLQTPYCLLISIPGIAVIRAATLAAEFGEPSKLPKAKSLCAYAGIVPHTEQTGGPDKAAYVVGLPRKCNRRLKNALLGAAHDQGNFTHPAGRYVPEYRDHQLRVHYKKVQSRNGKSGISTARVLVKVIHSMVKNRSIYLPYSPETKHHQCGEDLALYIECTFKSIIGNFTQGIMNSVPYEENIVLKSINEWKETMKQFHDIELNIEL